MVFIPNESHGRDRHVTMYTSQRRWWSRTRNYCVLGLSSSSRILKKIENTEYRKMDKSKIAVVPIVIHHCQNHLASTWSRIVCGVFLSSTKILKAVTIIVTSVKYFAISQFHFLIKLNVLGFKNWLSWIASRISVTHLQFTPPYVIPVSCHKWSRRPYRPN